MTEQYIPPSITNELGRSADAAVDRNYFSRGHASPYLSAIDGISVSSLLDSFGSPLFVFSEQAIRTKARNALRAFHARYPDTHFAWSYKTNYLTAICKIFHSEGWSAEVVSDFEYQKAKKIGILGRDIIYNGPYKPRESLEQALHGETIVQIDNWDELNAIEEIAKHSDKQFRVGVRIWMDVGIRPVWSKFGFALANGEANRAALQVLGNPKLTLETLHTHIGTYILAPSAYNVAAQKLIALRDQLELQTGYLVPSINLGGGFPSQSLLHGMVAPVSQAVPPIEAYADAIADCLNSLPQERRPKLILETGRHLIDEAGYLLSTITALKGSARPDPLSTDQAAVSAKEWFLLQEEAKRGIVIDAGINLLYTAAWFQINVLPSQPPTSLPEPVRLYGPLCMAIDVLRDHVDLPHLDVGQSVVLHPVGAYNLSQSMQFIEYRPAAVLICENGKPELIRRRERLEDIESPELLPAHLKE